MGHWGPSIEIGGTWITLFWAVLIVGVFGNTVAVKALMRANKRPSRFNFRRLADSCAYSVALVALASLIRYLSELNPESGTSTVADILLYFAICSALPAASWFYLRRRTRTHADR